MRKVRGWKFRISKNGRFFYLYYVYYNKNGKITQWIAEPIIDRKRRLRRKLIEDLKTMLEDSQKPSVKLDHEDIP